MGRILNGLTNSLIYPVNLLMLIEDNINVYPDSVSDNEKTFYYRVIGITSFADEGLPSEIVSAQAQNYISKATCISDG